MVAPGDQEFFRVTNAPCRIKEAGAVSDAARHGRPLVGDDLCGLFSMSARPPCSWRRMTAASSKGPSASSMDRNLKLNSTAHQVGVKRFGLFHGAGIQAMYETRLAEIKVRRDISEKEDWLDRQGVEDRSLSAIWRTCLMPGPYRPSCRVPKPLCSYRHRQRRILQSPPSRSS